MKISLKINLIIIFCSISLIGSSFISSAFKSKELSYFTIVEQLKDIQGMILQSLAYQKNFQVHTNQSNAVFEALDRVLDNIDQIDAAIFPEKTNQLLEIKQQVIRFRSRFLEMINFTELLHSNTRSIYTTVSEYQKTYESVDQKSSERISGSFFLNPSDVDTTSLNPANYEEMKKANLIALSLVNQLVSIVNQDILTTGSIEKFDVQFDLILKKLKTQYTNIYLLAEKLKEDEYRHLSSQLNSILINAPYFVRKIKENQILIKSIAIELETLTNKIRKTLESLVSRTVQKRNEVYSNVRNFQLAVQGLILFITLTTALFIGRSITLPLNVLLKASRAMMPGKEKNLLAVDLNSKLLTGKDELAELGRSFHEMRGEIFQKIEQLEQMDRFKDMFLANTSHELQTPLNGIIGISESLIDGIGGHLNSTQQKNINLIVQSGRRLSNLVNDILDYSKIKTNDLDLQFHAVNLHSAVALVLTILNPLSHEKSIKLLNKVPVDLPMVHADDDRLQQILINLINNAIKFTKQGYVEVTAGTSETPKTGLIESGSQETTPNMWVNVSDTGIGIPEEEQLTIFDSFKQVEINKGTYQGGTGLGLSITKQLVELHGGQIEVNSRVNEGTSFRFTLFERQLSDKRIDNKSVSKRQREILPKFDSSSEVAIKLERHQIIRGKILIVDDEAINIQVLQNHLALVGCQTEAAGNGRQALEKLNSFKPDLILLDLMMPDMNGFEVCKKIRESHPLNHLPIIFLTAKSQVNDLVSGLNLGANDYITKPFSKNELLARINTQLILKEISFKYTAGQEALKTLNQELENRVENRTKSLNETLEQLKFAQEELIQSERLTALGNMVAGIAHEINTPLGLGVTESSFLEELSTSLQKQVNENKLTQSEFNSKIKQITESSNSILRNLSNAAKLIKSFKQVAVDQTSESRREFQLIECIDDTLNSLKSELKKHQCQIEVKCLASVMIDSYPGSFSQIITNLVINALMHGFQNITTKKHIEIVVFAGSNNLMITFQDDGVGIDEETRQQIFDPFFTTKPGSGGTGLGLHIVYNIVTQKLGGKISCTSLVDKGTLFSVELPLDHIHHIHQND